jgi:hypothetical protein
MPRLILFPISNPKARAYFKKHSQYRGEFNLAIAAWDGKTIQGVIALNADGEEFRLGHISTDGNAQVGSLLYGAAWRAAKALGYQRVWI